MPAPCKGDRRHPRPLQPRAPRARQHPAGAPRVSHRQRPLQHKGNANEPSAPEKPPLCPGSQTPWQRRRGWISATAVGTPGPAQSHCPGHPRHCPWGQCHRPLPARASPHLRAAVWSRGSVSLGKAPTDTAGPVQAPISWGGLGCVPLPKAAVQGGWGSAPGEARSRADSASFCFLTLTRSCK